MQAGSGKRDKSGIFIYRTMIMSPAFQDLNKSGIFLLIALLDARKYETYKDRKTKRTSHVLDGTNLEMPYGTLKKVWGLNQQQVSIAIDNLLAKGFIEIVHRGGLGEHDRARYSLIDDYLWWTPKTPPIRCRERDVRRGYQGRIIGASAKLAQEIIL